MTKVCVSSTGQTLDALVNPRFGRCEYFIIVDTETMQYTAIENAGRMAAGGAGIQAAQTAASQGVEAIITGSVGPNAYPALQNAGITILTGASGSVSQAIEHFKQSSLSEITQPGPSHIGMGGGLGGGFRQGFGGGRGGGRGRGRGGRVRGGWRS